MRLYNDVTQESQSVYGHHTEHLNINDPYLRRGEVLPNALQLPHRCLASFLYNLVVIKRARRLSGQLPSASVGEWCASVMNLQYNPYLCSGEVLPNGLQLARVLHIRIALAGLPVADAQWEDDVDALRGEGDAAVVRAVLGTFYVI